jgi:hypothetical protein
VSKPSRITINVTIKNNLYSRSYVIKNYCANNSKLYSTMSTDTNKKPANSSIISSVIMSVCAIKSLESPQAKINLVSECDCYSLKAIFSVFIFVLSENNPIDIILF